MAIPDFQSVMLPLLKFCSDNEEHKMKEAVDGLSKEFRLTEDEKKKLLPSGRQPIFHNRVTWTKSFLVKARFAGDIESKIVLIDGRQLVNLMIDHDIGLSKTASYEIKRIDTDFFEE